MRKLNRTRARVTPSNRSHRRGAALVLAVALMFVLFSFLAFSIDTGFISQTRAELRRTADAAALAGCWELYSQLDAGHEADEVYPNVRSVSSGMAALNPVCRAAPIVEPSDVEVGYMASIRGGSINSDSSRPYYAVQVKVTRSETQNGQVPYFFGRIFGSTGRDMQTHATAVMGRQINGFSTPVAGQSNLNVLPFALDVETWDNMLQGIGATDDFGYDNQSKDVVGSGDGILEVNLYPQGTGSPGNRGTVDIGGSNNSTNDIARQILYGISADDLGALGKPLVLDDDGTMTLNGDTGISAGVKDEVASIVGQKRIIPLFSSVASNGNNANYTIVRWVGVRIMDVKLTGAMSTKKLLIQPASVLAPNGVHSDNGGSSSNFVLTPVLLAQ